MHHKRGRPKNRRAGCLMCKPWKVNGVAKLEHFTGGEKRKLQEGRPIDIAAEDEADAAREAIEYANANEF